MPEDVSVQEISKHNVPSDLWIVVGDSVYDLTEFAPEHPGGAATLCRSRSFHRIQQDTRSFAHQKLHPPIKLIGRLDASSITSSWAKHPPEITSSFSPDAKPPLHTLISTHDFISVARTTITPKTWAFYSSAATDLNTKTRNNSAYADIGLRPRILVNVKDVDTRTRMLGQEMSVPIFCSPAAMAKMLNPEGEKGIARASRKMGIPQCVSTSASFTIAEIFDSVSGDGLYGTFEGDGQLPVFFHLYVDKQREKSEKLLEEVVRLGVKAVFVTVDAPAPGKREADESVSTPMSGAKAKNDAIGGALGRLMGACIDASLCWDDNPWLRKSTNLPIVLKGVQTFMDVKKAADFGIEGVLLSSHGGRSVDTAPAPILLLLELQKNCPEVFGKLEVFVDGGVMRVTDIFKVQFFGAKSVGIGRGFLYALNYGSEGVEKYVEILKDELETTMRMMGVTNLSQVHPGMLNTGAVDHLIPGGEQHPYAKWRPKARM